MRPLLIWFLLSVFVLAPGAKADDWPQLQHDAQRTGRTADVPSGAAHRLRWLWMGPQTIVRNRLSNSAWSGPTINPGEIVDQKTPLPRSVPFTINMGVQVIVAGGLAYLGDMEGKVYAVNTDDGATAWTADNPGGTLATAAHAQGVVVWGSIDGWLRGYGAASGGLLWQIDTGGAVTAAPVAVNGLFCVGNQIGRVVCVNAGGGAAWTKDLGAPIAGGLASDGSALFLGAENMTAYALSLSDGGVRASKKISGQTFNTTWPMVFNGLVFFEAGSVPAIGSEFVMEDVMAAATSADDEQNRVLQWLAGSGAADASPDWKHLTVLTANGFTEPFTVPAGPVEGLGKPPYPPVADNSGRVLTYFKTKYPTLTRVGAFGTNYSVDISAVNLTTGRRVPINNNRLGGIWWWDTDNLFIPSVAGPYLLLHHSYHRGLYTIDLRNSQGRWIKTYHRRSGSEFSTGADVTYFDDMAVFGYVQNAQEPWGDRNAAAFVNGRFYCAEPFGLVALEPNN